jgi:hypothetical protein
MLGRFRDGTMATKIDDYLTGSMALGVAGYVAMILDCLAREELHLSDGQICRYAISGALMIAAAVAAGSLQRGVGRTR